MRRKKNTRQRAGTTHGWGSMKKHRGAGHRGGRGKAGSGKRGDAKKPSYWDIKRREGKHGFTSKAPARAAAINVGHLASSINSLAVEGLVEKKGKAFVVDCHKLGIGRLLGAGIVPVAMTITVDSASPKAVEKVKAAGGDVKTAEPADKE